MNTTPAEPKDITAEEFAAAMRAANHPWTQSWEGGDSHVPGVTDQELKERRE